MLELRPLRHASLATLLSVFHSRVDPDHVLASIIA
jgi:hypothetical protein